MTFSREQLLMIVTPHVLRTLVRLQSSKGDHVTEAELLSTGLSVEQRQALLQTKRLIPETEAGTYKINLLV